MKQWKLVLVALLSLLLVCTCMSAMAEDCTHYDADGKSLFAWVQTKAATCTTASDEVYQCSSCKYIDTSRGTSHSTAALGHLATGAEWEQTKAPTCTAEGEQVKKCQRSGCSTVIATSAIPAKGHDIVGITAPLCYQRCFDAPPF